VLSHVSEHGFDVLCSDQHCDHMLSLSSHQRSVQNTFSNCTDVSECV